MKYTQKTNCPNCGAVLKGDECEYCGTVLRIPSYSCTEPPQNNSLEKSKEEFENSRRAFWESLKSFSKKQSTTINSFNTYINS